MEEGQFRIEIIPAMECVSAVQAFVEYCLEDGNAEDSTSERGKPGKGTQKRGTEEEGEEEGRKNKGKKAGERDDYPLNSWREKVDRGISPFLKNDLLFLFQYYSHSIVLSYFILYKHLKEAEEFLASFENLNTEEFLSLYHTLLHVDSNQSGKGTFPTQKEIVDILERDRTPLRDPQGEASQLLSLLEAPEEFHKRISRSLTQFYKEFVAPHMGEAFGVLEKKQEEHTSLLEQSPKRFINTITRDNYSTLREYSETMRIVMTYFSESRLDLLMEGPFVIYGFLRGKDFADPDVETKTDTFLKALSDPNRIHILRLIKKRKYYGKELARALGITTATVSYHLEILMSSRLIKLDKVQKKRILYTLNREGIGDFLSSLKEEFLE